MKIKEVITEYVERGVAQTNASQIEPQFAKDKKTKAQQEKGIDPDHQEITSDFPV